MADTNHTFMIGTSLQLNEDQINRIEKSLQRAFVECLIDFDLFEDRTIADVDVALSSFPGGDGLAGFYVR